VITDEIAAPSGLVWTGRDLLVTDLGSGAVYRVALTGEVRLHAAGLPTGRDVMGAPTGPYKIQRGGDDFVVTQGWQDVDREEGAFDHALIAVASSGAHQVLSADFWNPYDLAWDGAGWFVTDASRNALMYLAPGATPRQLFAFDKLAHRRRDLAGLSPTEFKDDAPHAVDPVPTGVAFNGARVYVALFGGFPYLPGGGVVVSVAARGAQTARLELDALDAPIDVAFDPDGRLLVLEMGRFDLAIDGFVPGSGRLSRVDLTTGERVVLATGLSLPVTVAPLSATSYAVAQMSGSVIRIDVAD